MGWNNGVLVMDALTRAVDDATAALLNHWRAAPESTGDQLDDDERKAVDDAIRPHVSMAARILHEEGWNNQEDAEAFDRFPQEMLRLSDAQYAGWLRGQIADSAHNAPATHLEQLISALRIVTSRMDGTS